MKSGQCQLFLWTEGESRIDDTKKKIIQTILHLVLECTQGHGITWALGLTWSLALGPLQIPSYLLQIGRGPGVMDEPVLVKPVSLCPQSLFMISF